MAGKLLITMIFLLAAGCDLPQEPGRMPTSLTATEFEPGHNVFGMLRLDGRPGSSFIRVERAWETEETDDEFDSVIRDAGVTVIGDSGSWQFEFTADSSDGDNYYHPDFMPQAGCTYDLIVESPGLPTLTGKTTVPYPPLLTAADILIGANSVTLTIPAEPTIILYDIYLLSAADQLARRVVSNGQAVTVAIDPDKLNGPAQRLLIYGYDANLAAYQTTPTTIKPQTYHESTITVNGGYGCFGAVAVTEIILQEVN
ncbi:MAG: DUF4249 family protein [Candidatus Neomarinimicrobiota bacterium]